MKPTALWFATFVFWLASLASATSLAQVTGPMKLTYPATLRTDHVDTYHGEPIADPYRWLEDPDSAETKAWVDAQSEVTRGYLDTIAARTAIRAKLEKIWNFERFGLPVKREHRYFYSRNDGLQNQSVIYTKLGLDGEPRMLLDPNTLSKDGTVALSDWTATDDGKLMAVGISSAGSDWTEYKVLDVETGKFLDDHLKWIKFSGASWTNDGSGFFYSRYDEPEPGTTFTGANHYQKLYFHKLGDPQSSDTLIYKRDDEKEWGFGGDVSEDGKLLLISVWKGTLRKQQLFVKRLDVADAPVQQLITGFDAEYHAIGNMGDTLLVYTTLDAPLGRVIACNINNPARNSWKEVIPQSNEPLKGVGYVGGQLIAHYLKDAISVVRRFQTDGTLIGDVELPGIGSAGGFGGRSDATETFFTFTNYVTPASIYRLDLATGKSTLFQTPKVDFDPSKYETKMVQVPSKDGTLVPMTIVHKKGLVLDGTNPTTLYAYGGFNIPLTPGFSVSTAVWLEMGGIYAAAGLRGGGERGEAWHEAGMLDRKQNVFDDFHACAEWLIKEKYTSPKKLAIRGGSNGGLLVGAAMTQRPELYGACVPAVGVLDMLRFHQFTIGWAWVSEYGSSADAEQYKVLKAYSPLHNLKPGTAYPPTLVMTGDHDDRVVPAHSFKFAAELQHAHAGDAPVLIRIEKSAGHGAGTPTSKLIDSAADVLAFLHKALAMPDQPFGD
nr:prolyl oligopeptidase family serine peptidase [Pirellula staleyi]